MQHTLVRLLAAAAVTGGAHGILEATLSWHAPLGIWTVIKHHQVGLDIRFDSLTGDDGTFTLRSIFPEDGSTGHIPLQTFSFPGLKAKLCQNATNLREVQGEICQNATKPTAVPATTCGKDKAGLDDLDGGGTALVILLGSGLALSLALHAWMFHRTRHDGDTLADSKMLL